MNYPKILFLVFALLSATSAAEDPAVPQEQSASTSLALTRPGDGGVFAEITSNFRRQKDDARPFEWKDVDGKIDEWFTDAETRFPKDFQNHDASNWEKMRAKSKLDARSALAQIERKWWESIDKAIASFEVSEAAFYARNPKLLIRGIYTPPGDRSNDADAPPAWKLERAKPNNIGQIGGQDTYDSGDIVLKAAGLGHPMFKLRCNWDFSLEASLDSDSLDVRPTGSIYSPQIKAWLYPMFKGKSNRKVTHTWVNYDKSVTPIGPVKISIGDTRTTLSLGLGSGFNLPALDSQKPMPELRAGIDEPSPTE